MVKTLQQFIYPILITLLFSFLLSDYLLLRRGFYDLYIFNKVTAGDAALLLGVVLLIGPLAHAFPRFANFLHMRKELGVMVFVTAFLHSVISFFLLPDHFPLTRFQTQWVVFFFGVTSLYILLLLLIITPTITKRIIGTKLWWLLQQWGVRIAFAFTLLHIVVMKYPGWVNWLLHNGNDELVRPFMPPLSLLTGSFLIIVVVVRLLSAFSQTLTKASIIVGFISLFFLYLALFVQGMMRY